MSSSSQWSRVMGQAVTVNCESPPLIWFSAEGLRLRIVSLLRTSFFDCFFIVVLLPFEASRGRRAGGMIACGRRAPSHASPPSAESAPTGCQGAQPARATSFVAPGYTVELGCSLPSNTPPASSSPRTRPDNRADLHLEKQIPYQYPHPLVVDSD